MNILFLSLEVFNSINSRNIYTDLLREFTKNGHNVYSISPVEKKTHGHTTVIKEKNSILLQLKTGNIQKTNFIEKGISTVTIQNLYIQGIKKYFKAIKFELILYATPPITFCKVIEFVKKRDGAMSYLMLKDIFPQNAIDLGLFKKYGLTSVLYKYFRKKEIKLYKISDYIGCMSLANAKYLLKYNPYLDKEQIKICPNAIDIREINITSKERIDIRKKYDIPLDKKIFVYGGNLGKPQGIDFLIDSLRVESNNTNVFFVLVGDGTEFLKLERYIESEKPTNVKLIKRLPKEVYDRMIKSCDVGMIFLDHRFTIPNFPSRILSYMQAKIPVLACTDVNTDVGKVIVDGNFGWWCESNNVEEFHNTVKKICESDLVTLGNRGFNYLCNYYSADKCYKIIINDIKHKKTRVMVATDAHIFKTPDGKHWSKAIYSYDFWTRYLDVFDIVKIVARVKHIDKIEEGLNLVDGPGVEVHGIPFYQGPKQLIKQYFKIQRSLKNVDNNCDAAIFRMPSQTAQMTYKHTRKILPIAGEIVYDTTCDIVNSKGMKKMLNIIISNNLASFCKKANGISYVTEKSIQKHYPSYARLYGSNKEHFETYYSTITLSEEAFDGPRNFFEKKSLILALSDVAMNSERKGEKVLIEVVQKVRNRGYDVSAIIIGDGVLRKNHESFAKKLKLSKHVTFTGLLPTSDAVRSVLRKADIFVFPTQAEGLPRGILEAMALGMPVLSSPVGGIPEIVEEKYLFEPNDILGYTNMICWLLNHPDELNNVSIRNFNKSLEFKNSCLQLKRNQFYKNLKELIKQ